MIRQTLLAAVSLLIALVASSCATSVEQIASTEVEPTQVEAATPSPSNSGAEGSLCELVDDAVLESVTQSTIVTSEESTVQGLPICLHEIRGGGRLQVASMPAEEWIAALPDLMQSVRNSGALDDPEIEAKFDQAERLLSEGGSDEGQAACDLFSVMAEMQGMSPGSAQVVNYVPDRVSPQVVNGQRCSDAIFSSVLIEAEGIVDDEPTFDRIDRALAAVHTAGGGN